MTQRSDAEVIPTDYAEYRPIERPEDSGNSTNFDEI
jgi:hypothetical protein